MSPQRQALLQAGLAELPPLPETFWQGRNGESLATDEAAVWKRVLNYRIARHAQPRRILETHGGLGVSMYLYRLACPQAEIVSLNDDRLAADQEGTFELVDIDPFGLPYRTLSYALPKLAAGGILLVSNGEMLAVWRNLRKQQYAPTVNYGKRMTIWVREEYIPRLEALTGLTVRFFYAFPTTVRAVLAAQPLPAELWRGCPRWMWFLQRYESQEQPF